MRRRLIDERGAGLVGAIGGVVVVLAFVMLALQVALNLYATTTITAAAYDAARIAAGADADGDPAALDQAVAHARGLLGRAGDAAEFTWELSSDDVSLRVVANAPRVIPPLLGGRLGLDEIDRTVRVRREVLR